MRGSANDRGPAAPSVAAGGGPADQGSVLRFLLRSGVDAAGAVEVLGSVTGHRRHEFWPDDLPFSAEMLRGVVGHRRVTDAYLAEHARRRDERIATLDKGLAALHADVAMLIT